MAFGETLSNLRKTKGLSQEQLAEKLDLTRQTISKWELDQSTPDIAYLIQLSDIFGVTTDYLIKGEQATAATNSDSSDSKSNSAAQIKTNQSSTIVYRWIVFSGAIIMGASLIGIIAFVICSAVNPWGAYINNMFFDGLLGFLIGTKTLWFFILLSVLFIAGCLTCVYAIVKNIKMKR